MSCNTVFTKGKKLVRTRVESRHHFLSQKHAKNFTRRLRTGTKLMWNANRRERERDIYIYIYIYIVGVQISTSVLKIP